ncbi:7-keto-8-aminopelargonate synthetase-like enzyme [Maribacter vaceletii]|uniref:7-keto-8-aminopelargonate synthetase-like enzyme n=1 Tax=Maribacter vaceletii TaxID=1206816 RepID=A0A495DTF7_9FLAO|nr:pyridoxal phosphate-dependent aminotransferase family protein [Maribacter vaceletii]RKR07922.1 7-keto-8-aminopelargonate synthetase-like enzyme [Maribacter vaceletii]
MEHYIDSYPGREISIDSVSHLYFGGTSYLGLQTNKDFQEIFISNVKKYGTNYGASRKSNVRFSVYDETEKYLATTVDSEACITMSSGYLAGQLVADYYNSPKHKLFYTPNTHCAVKQNNTATYKSYGQLQQDVYEHIQDNSKKTPVILLDSIDFSGHNYPNFESLKKLPIKECILVVDDSHGIGILGENGGGVFQFLKKLKPKELIVCSSLGKGFAIQAGAIFGNKKTIFNLINTPFFGGASPATPANIATLKDAKAIYAISREKLHANTTYFTSKIKRLSYFNFMKGHPSFTFTNEKLTNYLMQNKVIVTNFNYPNKNSPLMSRIVINALHLKNDIDFLIKCLYKFSEEN